MVGHFVDEILQFLVGINSSICFRSEGRQERLFLLRRFELTAMKKISEHLYCFEDTCNVYVIKDAEAAILIDAGSGAVLDHLHEIGCDSVEWVLHTHHHRDQCWGDPRLLEAGARIAAPRHERHLFDQAELFWQTRRVFDNYDDRNNFFTVATNIRIAASLDDYESFTWRGHEFFILPAKGHTMGSVALLAVIDGNLIAFTGDLMAKGGKLYQLHAVEYTYGDMVGALFIMQSIQALRDCLTGEMVAGRTFDEGHDATLLPSHGEPIEDPVADIDRLETSLLELASLGRGLRVAGRDSIPEPLFLPDPKFVSLSPHLLWGGTWTCSFFYVLLSDSGKAMFIDYGHAFVPHMHIFADHHGMESMRFIEHHLKELRNQWDVHSVDLVVPTHIHDDHTCGIPHLQKHYGTQCYALDVVAQVLTDPAAWSSTPCTFDKPIRIDRTLRDGESFQWEGYDFDVYFAPGQTEFHSVLSAKIDGRKVAFTGDNYMQHEVLHGGKTCVRPFQTTVLRNSFQLDMHRRCVDVMRKIEPEVICPGHIDVFPCDKSALDEYASFVERKERVFRNLVGQPADAYIDLFWVRLLPYITTVKAGTSQQYTLMVRNNFDRPVTFEARLSPPIGWQTDDAYLSIVLEAGGRGQIDLSATAPGNADGVRRLITAEIRVDGAGHGPVAEALVSVVE